MMSSVQGELPLTMGFTRSQNLPLRQGGNCFPSSPLGLLENLVRYVQLTVASVTEMATQSHVIFLVCDQHFQWFWWLIWFYCPLHVVPPFCCFLDCVAMSSACIGTLGSQNIMPLVRLEQVQRMSCACWTVIGIYDERDKRGHLKYLMSTFTSLAHGKWQLLLEPDVKGLQSSSHITL